MNKNTLLLLATGLTIGGSLNAAIVANVELVTDASFENVSDAFGGSNANRLRLDSWFEINDDGDTAADDNTFTEAAQGGNINNTPVAPDGSYFLNLAPRPGTNPAGVYQEIGTWNTGDNTTFDFSGVLGDRSNTNFGSLTFEIRAGNFTGADGTDAITNTALRVSFGTFDDTGLSNGGTLPISASNVAATGLTDGDRLWFVISSLTEGDQSLVDSVSVQAVPEPSAYALIGGFLALGWVMVRRRS